MTRHGLLAALLYACSCSEAPSTPSSTPDASAGSPLFAAGAGGATADGTSGTAAGGAGGLAGAQATGSGGNATGGAGGTLIDDSKAGNTSLGGAAGNQSGGGAAGGTAPQAGGGSAGSGDNSANFELTSSELIAGGAFPSTNTCAGNGTSPALAWTAGPPGTKSYAITFFDTTLVEQGNANGYHWVIWDIPATTRALPAALPAGAALSTPVTAKQSSPANPFDGFPANAYFGPCPNAIGQTNNTDSYAFTIYALSVDTLTGNSSSVKSVAAAILATTPLAAAQLGGTSNAKPD